MVTPGILKHRAALFEQLAAMITAGVPLTKALELAERNRSIGVSRKVVHELTLHLQDGQTFSDAMQLVSGQKRAADGSPRRRNNQYWLSEFDIALLSAGEESGRLEISFKLLARYYAARAKIISDTISSLMVTVVTLHVFLLVFPISYLQSFAMGLLYSRYADCVPFVLEKAAAFGVLYGAVWFLAFASQSQRNSTWRALVENLCRPIPWLGTATQYLAVARLAMALDSLLSSGVTVIRAWELAAESCGSSHLKSAILKWTPELEAGTTPSDMVAQIRYFPDMFTQLYQSGEISGKLDETLTRLHTYYEEEGFRNLQTFCRVLNYALYFLMAGIAALFIIRFWLNYFSTITNSL
jgi:type II secretory pathway component PulF